MNWSEQTWIVCTCGRGCAGALQGELQALQKQIVELRRDLAARDDRTRLRDILGGIGYILGLMGLAFYFLGTRRKTEPSPSAGG
ncbi:MAG TPA: hypothetical protein PKX16_06700 [Kiritimatiellia bacterium]|nr:hypothetical protein [Kiritimatiellia bacterium]